MCRYGDIVPHTMAQRIFVTCMMLFGASLYGYIIGAVSAILSSAGDHRHKFVTTMNRLNTFMENRTLPVGLRCQLRHYFRCVRWAAIHTAHSKVCATVTCGHHL